MSEIKLLIKLSIAIFVLTKNSCTSRRLFEVHKPDTHGDPGVAAVEILTSCYQNKYGPVGLAGKLSDSLISALTSLSTRPIVLLDNTTRKVTDDSVSPQFPQKLQLFVVSASSEKFLTRLLSQIKKSEWWNHMASFLIVDGISPGSTIGCTRALENLNAAWKMNLLNAKYICYDPAFGLVVYDYNPFTNKAPKSWLLVTTFQAESDRPWTLFKQEYRNDDSSCGGLDFDKTADLDGYKIRATAKLVNGFIFGENKNGVDSFDGLTGMPAQMLFRAMSANATLSVSQTTDGVGKYDRNRRHIAMDAVNGDSDIVLNPVYQRNSKKYTLSSTVTQVELSILTQYSTEMSQLRKILSVVDATTRYGVLAVLIMTSIFFKVFRALDSMTAILNVVRLLCNSCLPRAPTNAPARIYLAGFFLLMINIQALFQGELASRLTKPMFFPNVETLEDLAEQGHTIYSEKENAYLFSKPPFTGRFREANDTDCIQHVLQDSVAACVRSRAFLIDEAKKLKLHLSRDSFRIMNVAYVIREDWPLEQKFNRVIAALTEAGLLFRNLKDYIGKEKEINEFFKIENEKEKYEVINLSQLKFIFVTLGIGLCLATICFFFELAIKELFVLQGSNKRELLKKSAVLHAN